jgi:hypothetical protein
MKYACFITSMGACAILRATSWLKGHSLENCLGMNTLNYSSEILRTILLQGVGHIPSESLHLSEWTKHAKEHSRLCRDVLRQYFHFISFLFNLFIILSTKTGF